jgi:inosine/xanthosine triphosphate pyrophosphatase family protein
VLLVPVELGGTAKVFNSSSADPTDSKNSNVANKVNGLFSAIVESPYLSAASAARHYAFADPGIVPACVVGFINGQEAPRIETENGFGYDGVQMRVILDYGTAVIDYRGAVTCAGA